MRDVECHLVERTGFVGLLGIVFLLHLRRVVLHVLLNALINIFLSCLYNFCHNLDTKPRKQDYYIRDRGGTLSLLETKNEIRLVS